MIAHEAFTVVLAFLAGVCIGTAFFAGLWWTVMKSVQTPRQGLVLVLSFLFRTTVASAAFFFIGRGHPDRFGACLIGFVVGRSLVMRTVGKGRARRERRKRREVQRTLRVDSSVRGVSGVLGAYGVSSSPYPSQESTNASDS
jgi:F1F0 ATPase subunit 2